MVGKNLCYTGIQEGKAAFSSFGYLCCLGHGDQTLLVDIPQASRKIMCPFILYLVLQCYVSADFHVSSRNNFYVA